MQPSTIEPLAPQERIKTIDIIRAFALFGVVIANFTVDNSDVSPGEGRTWFFDQLVYWPIRFFIDDKAMAMYCFLFGLGFSIQMLKAEARKAPFVILQMRRLVVLFLIGIIALILTDRTIPHEYAIVGLILLLFYKLPYKFLPILAILCVIVPITKKMIDMKKAETKVNKTTEISVDTTTLNSYVGVYQISPQFRLIILRKENKLIGEFPARQFKLIALSDKEFMIKFMEWNQRLTFIEDSIGSVNKLILLSPNGNKSIALKIHVDIYEALKKQLQQRAALKNTKAKDTLTYKKFIVNNYKNILNRFKTWSWSNFFWGSDINNILPFFLIGLYAGRRKIFYEISGNKQFLKKAMLWGFLIGVINMSVYLGFEVWNYMNGLKYISYTQLTWTWFFLSWILGVMAMTFASVAGLTLLLEKTNWKKRLSFLAPVGRMGFTNYLLHTIPYVLLFESFGLGLSGKIGPFYRLLIALPIYVILIILSRWWFKHFTIGPVEWLWRSLTYWKFQPMRLKKTLVPQANKV